MAPMGLRRYFVRTSLMARKKAFMLPRLLRLAQLQL